MRASFPAHGSSVVGPCPGYLLAAVDAWTGGYGGSLVYDYQFNVESLDGSTAWDETERDQLPAEHTKSGW